MSTDHKVVSIEPKRIEREIELNRPGKETVLATLQEVITDLQKRRETANKILIILYDDSQDDFYPVVQIYLGGATPAEGITISSLGEDECKNLMIMDE